MASCPIAKRVLVLVRGGRRRGRLLQLGRGPGHAVDGCRDGCDGHDLIGCVWLGQGRARVRTDQGQSESGGSSTMIE